MSDAYPLLSGRFSAQTRRGSGGRGACEDEGAGGGDTGLGEGGVGVDLFGLENAESEFEWEEVYGIGSVLAVLTRPKEKKTVKTDQDLDKQRSAIGGGCKRQRKSALLEFLRIAAGRALWQKIYLNDAGKRSFFRKLKGREGSCASATYEIHRASNLKHFSLTLDNGTIQTEKKPSLQNT